jgi:hypothetical protein
MRLLLFRQSDRCFAIVIGELSEVPTVKIRSRYSMFVAPGRFSEASRPKTKAPSQKKRCWLYTHRL